MWFITSSRPVDEFPDIGPPSTVIPTEILDLWFTTTVVLITPVITTTLKYPAAVGSMNAATTFTTALSQVEPPITGPEHRLWVSSADPTSPGRDVDTLVIDQTP